jgi:hypothetical protein
MGNAPREQQRAPKGSYRVLLNVNVEHYPKCQRDPPCEGSRCLLDLERAEQPSSVSCSAPSSVQHPTVFRVHSPAPSARQSIHLSPPPPPLDASRLNSPLLSLTTLATILGTTKMKTA